MTAEEQKKMQELEAENAALKERLLVAQRAPLRSTRGCSSARRRKGAAFPKSPEELTGSLFEQEMDPVEQARLDREDGKGSCGAGQTHSC